MSNKATDLVIGSYISLNNKIWRVVDKMHVKPGKGGAFIQAKLKSLDGTKLENRFSTSDTIEPVMIERKPCQFSYQEKETYVFTDNETYETIEIELSTLPKNTQELVSKFSDQDIQYQIDYADGVIIDVQLPTSITVTIDIADPVVKGQTAASSYKNAIIKGTIKIGVPPYVESGDKIVINPYGDKGIEFVQRA
ncbi:MAG: elongation factor P [Candidatus Woesearchaeota archaeon]|jgi:elongation factor P